MLSLANGCNALPHVVLDVDGYPALAAEVSRVEAHSSIAFPAQSMKEVANVPGSSLREAVAAIVDDKDIADRIAGELAQAGVSAQELEVLLCRAMGRDAWTDVARYALRDGLPSALVTLALNLWGFEGFAELTGDTAAAAALYGTCLGSAIVVLDEQFQHMFEGMTYVPATLASKIPAAPYLVATTLPLTLRNLVRAFAHASLVLAGRPELAGDIDNGIEVAGGLLATVTTGHAMQQLSLPGVRKRQGAILMREDLASILPRLRDGPAGHVGRVARQAGQAACRALVYLPAGFRKLATPAGAVTIATLTAFVPAALAAVTATRDAVHDDAPGIREGAAELARTGVLLSAYLLLAGAARYAAPAFDTVGAALRYVGGVGLTSASRMNFGRFTWGPGW
ncbi:hypothetical protein [Pinirhizobacter sp.]|jgi:hypothetical protein|uniref:hypothetical protein n=1 Tax=Pinirhizobacter sp. TaxID=2950432 RepID=UPI002F4132DE